MHVQIGQHLIGDFDQTVVGVEFLHRLVCSAWLPLTYETHVSVEVTQRTTKHHVVDVQMRVEIACDAGEDHGVRLVRVDEMLRGGGDIDGAHAANRCRNVDASALVGFDGAARHADAGFLRYGDVAQCGCDIGDFLVHGADDGDCAHAFVPFDCFTLFARFRLFSLRSLPAALAHGLRKFAQQRFRSLPAQAFVGD